MVFHRENAIVGLVLIAIGIFLGGLIGTALIIVGAVTVVTSFL